MAAVAVHIRRLKSVARKANLLAWFVSFAVCKAISGLNYTTLLVWYGLCAACLLGLKSWDVYKWRLFRRQEFEEWEIRKEAAEESEDSEDPEEWEIQWDAWSLRVNHPDELKPYCIYLKVPKSGVPPDYVNWYRSFIRPVVKWYTLPYRKPRLVHPWPPNKYHGSFQAMLSPRQVKDLMKFPEFLGFGDDSSQLR